MVLEENNGIMLIRNLRSMLHNSCETETILPSDWLTLFPSKFQYGKDKEDTLQGRGQEGCENDDVSPNACQDGGPNQGTCTCQSSGAPSKGALPSLAQETPLGLEEIIRRIAEAEWLEEVGRLPQ